jgi:hypothetical protein
VLGTRSVGISLALLWAWGNTSEAQESDSQRRASARLVYVVSEDATGCPERPAVVTAIDSRLGYDPFVEPANLIVSMAIRRIGESLVGTIRTSDAKKSQLGGKDFQVDAQRCEELVAEMVLAACLAVDPPQNRGTHPVLVTPLPPPAAEAPQAEVSSQHPKEGPSTTRAGPIVELTLSMGLSPAPAPGLLVGGVARFGAFVLELEGLATLSTHESFEGGSISVSLLGAMLAPCLTLSSFGACAVLLGGADQVGAVNLSQPHQSSVAVWSSGARIFYDLPLFSSAFFLRAQADLLISLRTISVDVGSTEVWVAPPVAFTLGLGAGALLPGP